jgi:pimeloyl-ACP methyl ester carboxylesterase
MAMASLRERDVRTGDGRIVRTAAFGSRRGFPVVWHHGNPGSRVAPVSETVLEDAGVLLITYDRPGGGCSDPLPGRRIASSGADVAAIADTWGIDQFGTAGFSGGGSFALATAALLGDRVLAAAVLSGAAPIDAEGLDFTAGMTDTGTGFGDNQVEQGRAKLLLEMEPTRQAILSDPHQALLGFVEEWPEADREALLSRDLAVPISEGMAECVRVAADGWLDDSVAFYRPWGFDIAMITVPVAIWHGRDDTAAPITHGRWLAERIPGCELHELDGGHYVAYVAIPDILRWLVSHA